MTGTWAPFGALRDFPGSLTLGRRCFIHAVSALHSVFSMTTSPRASPGPPSNVVGSVCRPGREVPSELVTGLQGDHTSCSYGGRTWPRWL